MAKTERVLTRKELTATMSLRQMLLSRQQLSVAAAVKKLTPLQAQHSPAPFIALNARLENVTRERVEAAIKARRVVKTTIMRHTLHLAEASDYPAYAQMIRHTRSDYFQRRYPKLDLDLVATELRGWFSEPRTNKEIRAEVRKRWGVYTKEHEWEQVLFARTLLPLVQLPPAGYWRGQGTPRFALGSHTPPEPLVAMKLVVRRYLAAFGPASRRDLSSWSGAAQRELSAALDSVLTISYRDEKGQELLDLPRQQILSASTKVPVRFLAHWDQPLLAYADRDRIIPPELLPLRLTLSGDPTVTVDGRVAASWKVVRGKATTRVEITPHREIRRSALSEIRSEARRAALLHEPEVQRIEVSGL